MKKFDNVTTHRLALGASAGETYMRVSGTSTDNSIVRTEMHLQNEHNPSLSEVRIKIRTGAQIVRTLKIPKISFLKIDAEGFDYDVVVGFGPYLKMLTSFRLKLE
ncbi:FkbM family methyltransferase [Ancylobacter sonchi]|uniref:FkbM family methyltransferase n=1 Tax=Ancylobacter sonchi TaxID=1937790 RepID=UPI001BD5D9EE|nr:FkbM family methyltransferase [Ancylobacter sonchi]MBS7536722.1 FkbM family methyltransferase [Ancylobacter sonchi]